MSCKRSMRRNKSAFFKRLSQSEDDIIQVYKNVAKVLGNTRGGRVGLKAAFAQANIVGKDMRHVYAIAIKVLNNKELCEKIITKSKIWSENPKLDYNLLLAIVTDLLWGCQHVPASGEVFDIINEKLDLLKRLKEEHGVEFKEVSAKAFFARVNTLKYSTEEFLDFLYDSGYKIVERSSTYDEYLESIKYLKPSNFMIDYHFDDLFVFHTKSKYFLCSSDIYSGNYIEIQDKASLLPVKLLDVRPGDCVLDMCAAPGMKTVYMVTQLQGNGKIIAVDRNTERYNVLVKKVQAYEAEHIVETFNQDITHFKCDNEEIDLVLLDAPCSGSGILTRVGGTDSSQERLQSLHYFQVKLLTQALTWYPNAKRIVYSTCSINTEENESVVDEVIYNLNNMAFDLVNCHTLVQDFDRGSADFDCGSFCIKINNQKDFTTGFFIALFKRKTDEVNSNINETQEEKKKVKKNKKKKHLESVDHYTHDSNEECNHNNSSSLSRNEEEDNHDEIFNNPDKKKKKSKKNKRKFLDLDDSSYQNINQEVIENKNAEISSVEMVNNAKQLNYTYSEVLDQNNEKSKKKKAKRNHSKSLDNVNEDLVIKDLPETMSNEDQCVHNEDISLKKKSKKSKNKHCESLDDDCQRVKKDKKKRSDVESDDKTINNDNLDEGVELYDNEVNVKKKSKKSKREHFESLDEDFKSVKRSKQKRSEVEFDDKIIHNENQDQEGVELYDNDVNVRKKSKKKK